jgi:C4-dicarboxylate-specific signal transduction histidine kinase
MSNLLPVFPFVEHTQYNFNDQNKTLNKILLTGKVNALDTAGTLFEYIEKTMVNFQALQSELIEVLLDENLRKLSTELQSKAQVSIDILIRNLFERTADVGFLATDTVLIDLIKGKIADKLLVQKRLIEYTKKYSVYDEIIVFDGEGNVVVNRDPNNLIEHSSDPIIQQALQADEYIERYDHTDMVISRHKRLVYAQKIVVDNEAVGVLVLFFKFHDELERIYQNLITDSEDILLFDNNGMIGTSNDTKYTFAAKYNFSSKHPYQVYNTKQLACSTKTKGYQGYHGLPWVATAVSGHPKVVNQLHGEDAPTDYKDIRKSNMLSQKLSDVVNKAHEITEDLSDVIINGELIASRMRVYVLTPILDNLRATSAEILSSINQAVHNLQKVNEEAITYDAKQASRLAIDIMDRNLYERANDCRWWALTPAFEQELSKEEPNKKLLSNILLQINDLYTVYTNLFVYTTNGEIIAASQDPSVIGQKFHTSYFNKIINNKNTQDYFVSPFETTSFYSDQHTYIYHATIKNGDHAVGGIGIVFDAYVEFQAMLEDSFPVGKEGFSLFCDRSGLVIASTAPHIRVGDNFEIESKYLALQTSESVHKKIVLDDNEYIMGVTLSQGYREYKNEDNYRNDVLSFTFIKV